MLVINVLLFWSSKNTELKILKKRLWETNVRKNCSYFKWLPITVNFSTTFFAVNCILFSFNQTNIKLFATNRNVAYYQHECNLVYNLLVVFSSSVWEFVSWTPKKVYFYFVERRTNSCSRCRGWRVKICLFRSQKMYELRFDSGFSSRQFASIRSCVNRFQSFSVIKFA